MAPVAGGVADGKEDRFVFLLCYGEWLWSPGIPVDRVGCMLLKVGACFVF